MTVTVIQFCFYFLYLHDGLKRQRLGWVVGSLSLSSDPDTPVRAHNGPFTFYFSVSQETANSNSTTNHLPRQWMFLNNKYQWSQYNIYDLCVEKYFMTFTLFIVVTSCIFIIIGGGRIDKNVSNGSFLYSKDKVPLGFNSESIQLAI